MNQAKGLFAKQTKQENKVYSSKTKGCKSTKLELSARPTWMSWNTLVNLN